MSTTTTAERSAEQGAPLRVTKALLCSAAHAAPAPGPLGWQYANPRGQMGLQMAPLGPVAPPLPVLPMTQTSPSRAVPLKLAGRQRYACQFCEKTFAHRISVALHMSCHQGKTVCPICHKVFSRAYNLKLHLNTVHNEQQQTQRAALADNRELFP